MGKKCRRIVQCVVGLIQNLNIKGFLTGKIYDGNLKHFCVPGMNCYACPAAIGACPIGALQTLYTERKPKFALYVLGFLLLLGVLLGRFVCGWLCLFGLIQELLYKIPTKKIKVSEKVDKVLRYIKYINLFVFVVLFPIILRDEYNIGIPYFCKYLCPIGILEGAIPLMIVNEGLRKAVHWLFVWKFGILVVMVLSSILIYRPFCKYMCPLGAFYSFFQKVSFLKLEVDKDKCVHCNKCSGVCGMGVNPLKEINSSECIRCGECVNQCPVDAIKFKKI